MDRLTIAFQQNSALFKNVVTYIESFLLVINIFGLTERLWISVVLSVQCRCCACVDAVTAQTLEPVDRPPAPVNVSARWSTGGEVLLGWKPGPSSSPDDQSTARYTVEYRTVGQWVPLVDDVHNTSYVWQTASRGVTYQFRVRAAASTSVHSHPSAAVSLLPDGLSSMSLAVTHYLALDQHSH